MYICDVYESSLKFYYQKFSNNNHPFAEGIPALHGLLDLSCLLTKHSIID